jgi:hypothetical protein
MKTLKRIGRNALKETDRGYAKAKRELERAKAAEVIAKVGIFGDTTENQRTDGPLTNVEIGTVHEFGGGNVPERSFLRSTLRVNREKYKATIAAGVQAIAKGRATLHQVLEVVGMQAAHDVKARITQGAGIPPPLAPATVAAKGSSRPLVDTGQLVNSITHRVERRGRGGRK